MDNRFNKLILHNSFRDTIEEINKKNIKLPPPSDVNDLGLERYIFPTNGRLVTPLGEKPIVSLDHSGFQELLNEQRTIAAYDESINKFMCLEGLAFLTSHSLVIMGEGDYLPMNLVTFYFYTRSNDIKNKTQYLKHVDDPEMESKRDCVKDKIDLLTENVPDHSILFIDGPLIGGDVYTYMIRAIERFLSKDIIPIFFVKNSSSNLVTDNTDLLKGRYNSDMHWAYTNLKLGQRTNFYHYVDAKNPDNAKVFCYLKAFDLSPQRIEFHVKTFKKYENLIPQIMNFAYYLLLVQGDPKNPQIRPISIAEKYARDTIRLFNINQIMRDAGATPTMNEERGMSYNE